MCFFMLFLELLAFVASIVLGVGAIGLSVKLIKKLFQVISDKLNLD